MKKAIVFGGTGLIGSYLLEDLLQDPYYDKVIMVARTETKISHPKLTTLVGHYFKQFQIKEPFVGDHVYITLGTTRRKTPDFANYYEIEHDYPIRASTICQGNGATSVMLVSAVGADSDSWMPYIRIKGEVEDRIIRLGYKHTHIFRPSLLLGKRKDRRVMEHIFKFIWPKVDWMLKGEFQKYRGIQAREVAKAMIAAAKKGHCKVNIYNWQEIKDLLTEEPA